MTSVQYRRKAPQMVVHWNEELAEKAYHDEKLIPKGFYLARAGYNPDRGMDYFVITKDCAIGRVSCRVEIGDWIVVLDCGSTVKFSDGDFHNLYERISND